MILGRLGRSKAMTWESGSALGQLRASAVLSPDDVLTLMSTRRTGISTRQAQERLDEYGENVITVGVRNTWLLRLAKSVVNPFNSILLLVAAVTYFTDIVASAKPDWITVGIILTLVFLSSLVAFIQAERSNAAVEGLTRMVSNTADVWRDGTLIEIPFQEVVPGDIVRLSAGDMLPADVRFLTTKDTFISQSVLTGESDPVEKASEVPEKPSGTLTDLPTIGFLGTDVVKWQRNRGRLGHGHPDLLRRDGQDPVRGPREDQFRTWDRIGQLAAHPHDAGHRASGLPDQWAGQG